MRDYRVSIPAGRSVTLCSGQNTYLICREITASSPAVPSVDVMAFSSVEAGRVVINANFIASRWFRARDVDAFTDVVVTNNNLYDIECVFSIGRGEIGDNVSAGDTFISGISSGVLPLPVTIPNTDLPLPVDTGKTFHHTSGGNPAKISGGTWYSALGVSWGSPSLMHRGEMLVNFLPPVFSSPQPPSTLFITFDNGVSELLLMRINGGDAKSVTVPISGTATTLADMKFKMVNIVGGSVQPNSIFNVIYAGEVITQ